MLRRKELLIVIFLFNFIFGCSPNIVLVKKPTILEAASAVSQSTNLSWQEGRIAFFSNRPAVFNGKVLDHTGLVFFMDGKGSQMKYFEGAFHSQKSPVAWSPDGQQMVLNAYDQKVSSYCVEWFDATFQKCLVKDGHTPSWSPDSKKIAYTKAALYDNGKVVERPALNVLDMGSGISEKIVALPESDRFSLSSWSPDNLSLAYDLVQKNGAFEIWVHSFSDGKERFLTNGEMPAWSPSGDEIVWIRDKKLFLYNFTTQQEAQLLREFSNIAWPAWSPDGKKLLFVAADSGSSGIYYLDRPSNKVLRLTNDGYSDEAPSWRP